MPARQGPNAGMSLGWSPGEDYWGGPMNDNLLYLDTMLFMFFRSASRSSPPADAKNGDIHIVAQGGSDAWGNADGMITVMDQNKWTFYLPKRGMRAYLESTQRFIWYNGSEWLNESDGSSATNPTPANNPKKYHVNLTIPYQPAEKELLMLLPVVQVIQMPKGAVGSAAALLTASPGYVRLTIMRNESAFGYIDFEKGASDGTFYLPETTTLTVGDRLEVYAPDDSLQGFRDLGITLVFNAINE